MILGDAPRSAYVDYLRGRVDGANTQISPVPLSDPDLSRVARVAINFVMNYEEGSEPSVQDGEGYTETGLTESRL